MTETEDRQRHEKDISTVPLAAETAHVEKRFRTTGRVQVKTRVETEKRTLTAELEGEEVEIERVPRNEPVATVPEIRVEDGVTIIPLVEEQLVVEKRLVLVEEVRLQRVRTKETATVPVELRAEKADVERVEVNPGKPPNRS